MEAFERFLMKRLSAPFFYLLLLSGLSVSLKLHAETGSCSFAKQALIEAAQYRQLPKRKEVACRTLNRKQFRDLSQELLKIDVKEDYLSGEEVVFSLLGLIPQGFRYAQCFIDSYSIEAAAFYDARRDEMIVPDWFVTPKAILVHEAAHALQDQYFDLLKIGRSPSVYTDSYLAAGALIEGDAMQVERKFSDHNLNETQDEEVIRDQGLAALAPDCTLPPALLDLFYFQYDHGSLFAQKILARGGLPLLNSAFRNPPHATEEIIHPEKYPLSPTEFRTITSPKLSSDLKRMGFVLTYSETLGEMMTRSILKDGNSPRESALAAAGWGGDRVSLFTHRRISPPFLLIWESAWDSRKDAQQFLAAIQRKFSKKLDVPIRIGVPFLTAEISGISIKIKLLDRTVRLEILKK